MLQNRASTVKTQASSLKLDEDTTVAGPSDEGSDTPWLFWFRFLFPPPHYGSWWLRPSNDDLRFFPDFIQDQSLENYRNGDNEAIGEMNLVSVPISHQQHSLDTLPGISHRPSGKMVPVVPRNYPRDMQIQVES